MYLSMREPRPHRPAREADEAVAEMRAEVRAGRLDGAAVDAALAAAGHRPARRREALRGLTAREVEVLILLVRGFYMPPGHVPAAQAGTEFIQFSPREQLAETVAVIMANARQAMQGA